MRVLILNNAYCVTRHIRGRRNVGHACHATSAASRRPHASTEARRGRTRTAVPRRVVDNVAFAPIWRRRRTRGSERKAGRRHRREKERGRVRERVRRGERARYRRENSSSMAVAALAQLTRSLARPVFWLLLKSP